MAQHDGQQNAALPVAFNRFLQVMNMDAAKDLVRMINTFMKDFKHRPSKPEVDSQAVQAFLQQMETAMAKHSMFADSTPAEQDAATEALEKYLMTKLFDRTFRQTADDVERDDILALRCAALQFVVPAHLEIPDGVVDDQALATAVMELNKINQYKAPRDKLVCILNCCRMLTNMLTSRSKAEGIGADDFTPLLIYVVIRAQTPQLASNLAYIERYRYHSKLTSETQYYYIQLCGAATFIEMVNATSLKVDRDEFIAHMLAAGAMSDEQLLQLQSSSSIDGQSSPLHPAKDSISKSTAQAAAQAAAAGVPVQQQQSMVQVAVPGPAPAQWYEQQPQQQQQQQQQQLRMQAMPAAAAVAQDYYGQQRQQQQYYQQPPVAYGQLQQQQQQYHRPQQQQQQQQLAYQQYIVQPQQQQQGPGFMPLPSVAQLEVQGTQLLAGRGASAVINSHIATRYPFSCSTLEGLSLGDVGKLLICYKELVLRHEALVAALEYSQQQQQQQQSQQDWSQATGAVRPPTAAANSAKIPPAAALAGAAATPPPPPAPSSTAWPAAPNVMAPISAAAAPGSAAATMPPLEPAAAAAATPQPPNPSLQLDMSAATDIQVADGVGDAAGKSKASGGIESQTRHSDGQTEASTAAAAAVVDASLQLNEGVAPAHSGPDSHQTGEEHELEHIDDRNTVILGQQQQLQHQEEQQQQQGLDPDGQVDVEVAAAAAGVGTAQQQGAAGPHDKEQQQQQSVVDELLLTLLDGETADAPVTAEPLQQQQQQQHVDGPSQQQQQNATNSTAQSTADGADLFEGPSVSNHNQALECEPPPAAAAAAVTSTAAGTMDAADDDDLFGFFQGSVPGKSADTPAAAPSQRTASAGSLLD